MTQQQSREAGLAAMLADSLLVDRPDPELLARYVDDPYGLSPEECSEIEWHLANSPGYAEQLSVLRHAALQAPEQVARTLEASPALFWYLDQAPPRRAMLQLSVTRADAVDPLVRESLPIPEAAGLQVVRLASVGVELPVGVPCRWCIELRSDPEDPATGRLIEGWVRRMEASAQLQTRLDSLDPAAVPAALAEAGIWYDALEKLVDLAQQHPDRADVQSALRTLLAQGGVELP